MEKAKRIAQEYKKLAKLYESLPENRKQLCIPLMQNAAFMKVTLDELQVAINETGCSEEYQNGENQHGRKASADLQAYNSTMKMYTAVIDRLDKMLPAEQQKSKLDELMKL